MVNFTIDLDFNELLRETQKVYQIWQMTIKPMAPPGYDPTLSKNAYNLILLSSYLPTYYNLWQQVLSNIKGEIGSPTYVHAWLNVHRSEDLCDENESLNWHNHSYADYHGFVHISNKNTDTVFKDGQVIPNKQGQMCMFEAAREHRVENRQFSGIRASIGFDILHNPNPAVFVQQVIDSGALPQLVPIL